MSVKNYFMRFPGGKAKALTLSYDDDVKTDIRFCEILDKYGLKCTFNINSGLFLKEGEVSVSGRRFKTDEAIEFFNKCLDNGHEVAVHGYRHPWLESLPPSMATIDVLNDRIELEKMFGRIIRGMAYPQGTYDDEVVNCLRACGIAYSRTTKTTERFDIPTDWLRMPATCHHNNPRLMELANKFLERKTFRPQPQLFYLWGHTYEFDDNDNWNVIEEFAEYMGGRDEIWYATNIEIYEYIEDYNRLVFSADGQRVYNPTNRTLYFNNDYTTEENVISVAPAQTVEVN